MNEVLRYYSLPVNHAQLPMLIDMIDDEISWLLGEANPWSEDSRMQELVKLKGNVERVIKLDKLLYGEVP